MRSRSYLKVGEVPERQIIEELLKEIERICKDSGVSIINLSPQEAKEESKGKKYKADLRIEGSTEGILSFLYKTETSKLLLKLDRLSVGPKDEQASVLRLEATVSVSIP